jgi:3-hydroxy-4-methylanthranilate adenylyltransferase
MENTSWWGAHLLSQGNDDDLWAISGAAVTRAQLRWKLAELYRAFHDNGIRNGSSVVLRMAPSLTFLQALFALWGCGAQVMLIDFRMQRGEYEPLVNLLKPQYVVSSADNGGPVVSLHVDTGFVVQQCPSGEPNHTDICLIQLSSGSTGKPKVMGRSPESLLAELDRYAVLDGMPGSRDRLVLLNSITHSMGLTSILHCLNVGTTLVLPPSMRPADVLRLTVDTEACAIFGVPAHFDLLNRVKNSSELPSLRLAVSGGERLPLKTYENFWRRYRLPIRPSYGMAEVGIIASDLTGTLPPPAVGFPAPGIEVKVVNQELYVRMDHSPYLFTDQPGRFVDGWLRTYDQAKQDSGSGVLSILGRADSLIIIGGVNIDLTEVEVALMRHPQVSEVVVTYGEAIEAFVVGDGSLDANKLTTWCRNKLSPIKIPKRFFVVRELPRNSNGKLIRSRELMRTTVSGPLHSPN